MMNLMKNPVQAGEQTTVMTDANPISDLTRLHAVVEGHVQGVGFRYFVLTRAQQLNLSGWVRNTSEGNVEVMAEGTRDSLDELMDSLRKGPRSSFVTNVRENWEPGRGEFRIFDVRSTH